MAKAERPKSAMAISPVRPCRGSGKAAQVAFSPESRDGNSSIPTVNHFLGDLRIPQMHILQNLFQESSVKYTTFRIAEHRGLTTAAAVTQTFNGWIRPAA